MEGLDHEDGYASAVLYPRRQLRRLDQTSVHYMLMLTTRPCQISFWEKSQSTSVSQSELYLTGKVNGLLDKT